MMYGRTCAHRQTAAIRVRAMNVCNSYWWFTTPCVLITTEVERKLFRFIVDHQKCACRWDWRKAIKFHHPKTILVYRAHRRWQKVHWTTEGRKRTFRFLGNELRVLSSRCRCWRLSINTMQMRKTYGYRAHGSMVWNIQLTQINQ